MHNGQTLFNVSKGDENYALLYDGKPRDENFKVLEKAVCMQVEEWTWHVCDLAEDVVGLANGKQMRRRGTRKAWDSKSVRRET